METLTRSNGGAPHAYNGGTSNGISTNSSLPDDCESLSSSHSGSTSAQPGFVELNVALPNGQQEDVTVEYGKQMLDLLVMLCASYKLSPASHLLILQHPGTGDNIKYKASETIGSLGVTTVHVISKQTHADNLKRKERKVDQPFDKTQRLQVNLPRGQKTVLRVKPTLTVGEIYTIVCKEKNLDRSMYEVRHPRHPTEVLPMTTTLQEQNLHEITVAMTSLGVTVVQQKQQHHQIVNGKTFTLNAPLEPILTASDNHQESVHSQGASQNGGAHNDMPRKTSDDSTGGGYMPGMGEKKKKKGLFGLFGRKKDGKFKVSEATSSGIRTKSQSMTGIVEHQYQQQPQPQYSTVQRNHLAGPVSTSRHASAPGGSPSLSANRQQDMSGTTLASGVPRKPQRNQKRTAPPPPPPSQVSKNSTEVHAPVQVITDPHTQHSRGSSHSSGFDEGNMSPLESPGNSSRDSGTDERVPTSHGSNVGQSKPSYGTLTKSQSAGLEVFMSLPRRAKKLAPVPPAPPGGRSSAVHNSVPADLNTASTTITTTDTHKTTTTHTSNSFASPHATQAEDDSSLPPPPAEFTTSAEYNHHDTGQHLPPPPDEMLHGGGRHREGDLDSLSTGASTGGENYYTPPSQGGADSSSLMSNPVVVNNVDDESEWESGNIVENADSYAQSYQANYYGNACGENDNWGEVEVDNWGSENVDKSDAWNEENDANEDWGENDNVVDNNVNDNDNDWNGDFDNDEDEWDEEFNDNNTNNDNNTGFGAQSAGLRTGLSSKTTSFGEKRSGFGEKETTIRTKTSVAEVRTTGFGVQTSVETSTAGFGARKSSSFDAPTSGFGAQNSAGFGPRKSSFDAPTSGFGAQRSVVETSTTGFGARKSSFDAPTSGFGAQKSVVETSTAGFGARKSSVDAPASSFGAQKSSFGAQKHGFGSHVSNTNKGTDLLKSAVIGELKVGLPNLKASPNNRKGNRTHIISEPKGHGFKFSN